MIRSVGTAAYSALSKAPDSGSFVAIRAARAALGRNYTTPAMVALKRRAEALANALNHSLGDVAVANQDHLLNMENIDAPLSDAAYIVGELATIEHSTSFGSTSGCIRCRSVGLGE